MSSDKRFVLSVIEPGTGRALDLGGGGGSLAEPLRSRGYAYTNVDLTPGGRGAVRGDAQHLPFADSSFDLVVSSDSLEHFPEPDAALREARRVLSPDGMLVIWVPFLHPFHGDDLYRYTPLGLRYLLQVAGFRMRSLEAPLSLASLLAQAVIVVLRRVGLESLEPPIERAAAWVDARVGKASFAAAYLVVADPEMAA